MLAFSLGMALAHFAAAPIQLIAQESSAESASISLSDVEAIRASAEAFAAAFNRHDATALAAMWTPDGEYTSQEGRRFEGRDAIRGQYEEFFAANDDVKMHVAIESIRLLSPTTAIEEGRATLAPMPEGAPGASQYTAVHVKQDGRWLLASVRDTRIEIPSTYGHLQDLEFLVGDWTAEHENVRAEMTCRWIAQKSYLKREFKMTRDGRDIFSSTELIGWDPLRNRIVSWSFLSRGGRAEGVWTSAENAWFVESAGITRDGLTTSAVNVWTPLEGGAIGFRSVERTVEGLALDDARDIVFKPVDRTDEAD